ncbi:hypothetical protein M569_00115 [Genlisea aurea]|uniref:Reverse transcriptase Ty1/copia-type domain-containing protein n=1 Tax=Genlisea aurea TaxID=192259 RepID=S8DAU5_9LAMI|nr:hypothetical protein M569_00115 [Genlisea aurea]
MWETFVPVVKLVPVRCLLTVTVKKKLVHQLDVNNAFFHGDLKEEVYMKISQGEGWRDKGFILRKSLYGLKQASQNLYTCCQKGIGFIHSKADHSFARAHKFPKKDKEEKKDFFPDDYKTKTKAGTTLMYQLQRLNQTFLNKYRSYRNSKNAYPRGLAFGTSRLQVMAQGDQREGRLKGARRQKGDSDYQSSRPGVDL